MTFTASHSDSRSNDELRLAGRTFALGLGLTNECNLACSFCYRDPARTDRLSLAQIRSVLESLPIRSVNLGTGAGFSNVWKFTGPDNEGGSMRTMYCSLPIAAAAEDSKFC